VKNKKLFAILTLVCFMFTLMPVAAFAAPADYAVKVTVGSEEPAEDVYVTAGTTMSVLAYKGDVALAEGVYYAVNADGEGVQIAADDAADGVLFAFKLPGAYTIYGVEPGESAEDLADLVEAANSLTSNETVANAVKKIEAQLDANIIKTVAYVTVEAPEANYKVEVIATNDSNYEGTDTEDLDVYADGGFSLAGNAQVTVQLTNNTKAVVGKVPTIVAPDYVTVVPANAKKVVTDAAGKITYNISANRAGDFKVVFSYEDAEDAVVAVNATNDAVANVEVAKASTALINNDYKDTTIKTGAFVKFTDAAGNVIIKEGVATDGYVDGDVKVTVVSQPTNSKLTAANFKLVKSATVAGASELEVVTSVDLKVGSYEVKFALANGKNVTVAFETAKMGDAVGIRFVQPATTVGLGADNPNFTVQAYDAKGVTETLAADEFVLSAQGKAVKAPTEDGKLFGVINEDKYIGSTITVLAKTADNKFIATTALEVVENGSEVVYANNTAEVGVTAQLTANVVDVKGNKVNVSVDKENISIVVLDKPANAYVYAEATNVAGKNITVTFLGSIAGEYKIQTIIFDGNEYVTGTETIVVGGNEAGFEDVVVISMGADKMIVNDTVVALDVVPFIENNRTMMQFNVLYVFGIDVEWVAETQSIVAEGNGLKVVMQLGSKVATVNGEEVALDVAPYSVNGRTVVPVGFITGLLDITPTFTYNADGTIADILFAK